MLFLSFLDGYPLVTADAAKLDRESEQETKRKVSRPVARRHTQPADILSVKSHKRQW